MNAPAHIPQEVLTEAAAAARALEAAQAYPVPTTAVEYQAAGDQLKAIKARANTLEDWRTRLKKPILEAGKALDAFFKAPADQLAAAEKAIKRAMLTYDERQAELRRQAEREAAEANRREQERLRAEAARVEAAARAKREKEEAAARAKREQEEAAARALEEQGRAAEAERRRLAAAEAEAARLAAAEEAERQRLAAAEAQRLAAETMPTAPVVHMESARVEGTSTREVWSAEVTDKMALIRAVASGQAPAELIDVNTKTLNQMARALKAGLNYPGVRAVCEKQMAVRA